MTEREALKLALEALENLQRAYREAVKLWDPNHHDAYTVNSHSAIADIREALAQPEQEPVIDKSAAIRIATALGWEPKRKPLSEERIDDIWNLHCDEMGYVSVSDAVELARDFEAAHGIKE